MRVCRKKIAAETSGANWIDLDACGVRKDSVKEDGVATDARARIADGGGARVDNSGEHRAQLERLVAARDAEPRFVVVQEASPDHLWQRFKQPLHLLVITHCVAPDSPFPWLVFFTTMCSFTHFVSVCSFVRDLCVFLKKKKTRRMKKEKR